MLSQSQRVAILELHAEKVSGRQIARALKISRLTVREVLRSGTTEVPAICRTEICEPYRQQILELLPRCKGNLARVREELAAIGAQVSYSALTAFCRRHGIGQAPVVAAGRYLHRTSHVYRAAIRRKMAAFHVHVQLGCIAQGLLQHLSLNHTAEVWLCFRSWLRTMNPALPPSELVVANALRSAIPRFFSSSQLDPKLKKILDQYSRPDIHSHLEEIAA